MEVGQPAPRKTRRGSERNRVPPPPVEAARCTGTTNPFGRQRGRHDRAHADARPWLYGIATRLIGRHRRDEVRFFRAIARTGVDPAAELIADEVTRRVAAQAATPELAAALAALPPGYRDVLLLNASGLGYQETATALGVPVGTVSSRLMRARQRMRALMGVLHRAAAAALRAPDPGPGAQAVISASVVGSAPKTSAHAVWGGETPCIA